MHITEELEERTTNTRNPLPTMKYNKNKNWDMIRNELFSIINAFEPTVIDNSEQVKEQAINLIEREIADTVQNTEAYKEEGLTYNTLELEGYKRGCVFCLSLLKEYL